MTWDTSPLSLDEQAARTAKIRELRGLISLGEDTQADLDLLLSLESDKYPSNVNFRADPANLKPFIPFAGWRASTDTEREFRHSGWAPTREQVIAALASSPNTQPNLNRLERFKMCGACAMLEQNEDKTQLRVAAHRCEDRFCVPCQKLHAAVIAGNLATLCGDTVPLMITLTLKHQNRSLRSQIDRLYRSFAELRRDPWFKSQVPAGACFFETKISSKDGLWHNHLHILAPVRFVDHARLSQRWLEITGDSNIVHLKRFDNSDAAMGYVCKYLAKPIDQSVYENPKRLLEVIEAMHRLRRCNTFGEWRGTPLHLRPADDSLWFPIMTIEELYRKAAAGDAQAIRYKEALARSSEAALDDTLFNAPERDPP